MWVAPLERIETFTTMTDPREEGVSPSQLGGLFQRILEDCKVGQPAFSHFLGLSLRLIVGGMHPVHYLLPKERDGNLRSNISATDPLYFS